MSRKFLIKFCDYIYDMPKQMMAADLVIARAGAITLAELSCLGKPAILIPSPNVTDNHQYKNALVYAESGAAVLIEEKDLTAERLKSEIDAILTSPEKLAKRVVGIIKKPHTVFSYSINRNPLLLLLNILPRRLQLWIIKQILK